MQQRTPKQQIFLDKWLETGNLADAAQYAGSKAKTRRALSEVGRVMLLKMGIEFDELMEEIGIDDRILLQKLKEGLDATKVISCNVIAIDKEGMKDADSMTKDFVDVPDFLARHKYLETSFKLKGKLKDKMELTGKDGAPLIPPDLMLDFGGKVAPK